MTDHAPSGPGPAPVRVAIQGELGSFSHAAAARVFGPEVEILPCRDFGQLFAAVSERRVDHGAVPVENALAGAVVENLDLMVAHDVHATHEAYVRVELCLVVPPGTTLADVRTVASHPVALRQCQAFLDRHEALQAVPAYDTAGSVRDLLTGEGGYDAAIGSALAAELYGGEILERGIEDNPRNYTRFLIIGLDPGSPPPTGSKTTMIFTLAHRPGSLHRALGCFAARGVDLFRIESRPIPGRPWEYRFHVDAGGVELDEVRAAVEDLRRWTSDLKVLGTYPAARPEEI